MLPLSPRDALFYLLERGLLEREDLLDRDPAVWDASRRNRNLKVRLRDGRGFFLKQLASSDPRAVESIRREASVFWLAGNDPDFRVLRAVAPACVGYDAHRGILVFELVPGAPAWDRAVGAAVDIRVARALGRTLGRVHREAGCRMREAAGPSPFPRTPPWILSLHRLPVPDGPAGMSWPGTSAGMVELMKLVRSSPELSRLLDEARELWQEDGLVHGDLKWDNVLLLDEDPAGPTGGGPRTDPGDLAEGSEGLRIADWELTDLGDTAWDVGSVLQSYWNQRLLGGAPDPGRPSPPWATWQAGARQVQLRAAAAEFWGAYADARRLEGTNAGSFLSRSVRLGAAREVLTAYEYLHGQRSVTPEAIRLLRDAVGVFRDPAPTVDALAAAA